MSALRNAELPLWVVCRCSLRAAGRQLCDTDLTFRGSTTKHSDGATQPSCRLWSWGSSVEQALECSHRDRLANELVERPRSTFVGLFSGGH
jgi:hypothetical protein